MAETLKIGDKQRHMEDKPVRSFGVHHQSLIPHEQDEDDKVPYV